MAFGGGHDEGPPWRDTMQICLDGHVITDALLESPELSKKHCPKDGTETVSACSSCREPIPGRIHYPNINYVDPTPPAPERCENCSDLFPWTGKSGAARASAIAVDDVLRRLFDRFNIVVRQMRQRHDERLTLDVADEYDVQNLLHALMRLYWDDIRPEEWTPSYAEKSARVDFFLPTEQCVVEVKMTRAELTAKTLGNQLLVDIARYAKMHDCRRLYCFIFDPDGYVKNPRGLESDLEKQSNASLQVKVLIRP